MRVSFASCPSTATGQTIHGKDHQHVVYAPIVELIEHAEPVLGGFALTKPNPEALLASLQVDADHQIGVNVFDAAIHPELEEQASMNTMA